MFNDHLSNEMAKERVNERMKEVETYSLQKRLGYADNGVARWILALVLLIALATLILMF